MVTEYIDERQNSLPIGYHVCSSIPEIVSNNITILARSLDVSSPSCKFNGLANAGILMPNQNYKLIFKGLFVFCSCLYCLFMGDIYYVLL